MNALSKRDQIIAIALAAAMVCAALYMYMVRPQSARLERALEEASKLERKVKVAEAQVKMAPQYLAHLAAVQERVQAIEETMATGDLYSWGLSTVKQFLPNYKVNIPEFTRPSETEAGLLASFPYRAMVFTVRGAASYHELGKFVAGFENAFPYVRLQNLQLDQSPTAHADEADLLSFKMDVVALIKPDNAR
jgi:Tfp pilus assembly protein PilO